MCRTEWEEEDGGRIRSTYCIEPRPGLHILRWRGVWIRLERVREQQQVDVIGKKCSSCFKFLIRTAAAVCCYRCLIAPLNCSLKKQLQML